MSFTLPSETVVASFLPTFRRLLAERLDEAGVTQSAIADALGVSQPAVSQYVAGDVAVEPVLAEDPDVRDTVDRLAARLAADQGGGDAADAGAAIDEPEMLAEVVALVRSLQDRGALCELHEQEMPSLQGLGCDVCVRGSDQRALAERRALHAVRDAVRALQDAPVLADHVPDVGSNVAQALPDASDPTDVAAVPGRITAMRGRIHVPADPEFGASSHVATVLLAARDADAEHRGAVNLATSDTLLDALADGGHVAAAFAADDDVAARRDTLADLLRDDPPPAVLYHEGAFGVEPVTYVLGPTASDAVAAAAEAVRSLG